LIRAAGRKGYLEPRNIKPGLELSRTERIPGTKKYKTWIRAEQDGKDTWNQEIY